MSDELVSVRFTKDLPKGLKSDYNLLISKIMREAVEETTKDIKANAPVRTGNLKRNIKMRKERGKIVLVIEFGAPYTIYVEEKKTYARGKPYPFHHFIKNTVRKRFPRHLQEAENEAEEKELIL